MLRELIESNQESHQDLFQGFNEAQNFVVRDRPFYTKMLEKVRGAAHDKWGSNKILGWDDIVEWVSEECPEPLSNEITLPKVRGTQQAEARGILENTIELVNFRVFVPHSGAASGTYSMR